MACAALAIGALGMYRFVQHCLGQDGRGLYASLGGLAYLLNPATQIMFGTASLTSMWWYAAFPWLLFEYYRFLTDRDSSFTLRILPLIVVNILAFPAFTIPLYFVSYLAALLLLSFGLWFTPYVFRSVWITPGLLFIILLIQFHWLGPTSVQLIEAPTKLLDGVIRLEPASLASFSGFALVPLLIAFLGLFRFRYCHIPVAALTLALSLFFVTNLPAIFAGIRPYQGLTLMPGAFGFSYFFAFGAFCLHDIVVFITKKVRKRSKSTHSTWDLLHGKSPFDIYDELVHHTKKHHPNKQFTLLKFTEHFVHHIMTESSRHHDRASKQRTITVRSIGFGLFFLLLVANLGMFRGTLFPAANKIPYTSDLVAVISYLQAIPATKRVQYVHTEISDLASMGEIEIKAALQSEDPVRLKTSLEKYRVAYLLLDDKDLPNAIRRFIVQANILKKQLQSGSIQLYTTPFTDESPELLSLVRNAPNIGPEATTVYHDSAYEQYGLYVTQDSQPYDAYYPFLSVADMKIDFAEDRTALEHQMNQNLMKRLDQYELETASEEAEVKMIKENGDTLVIPYSLYTELYGDRIQISMDTEKVRTIPGPKKTLAASEFTLATLEQRYGYMLTLDSGNNLKSQFLIDVTGKDNEYPYHSLSVTNKTPALIPSAYGRGVGYTFSVFPGSFRQMNLYYIPFEDIIKIRMVKPDTNVQKAIISSLPYKIRLQDSIIEIETSALPPDPETLAVMFQPFDSNWLAYRIDEHKVTTILDRLATQWLPFRYGRLEEGHVKINNWANGWTLDTRSPAPIVLVYWPRYLTFIGWLINAGLIGIFLLTWIFHWYRSLRD